MTPPRRVLRAATREPAALYFCTARCAADYTRAHPDGVETPKLLDLASDRCCYCAACGDLLRAPEPLCRFHGPFCRPVAWEQSEVGAVFARRLTALLGTSDVPAAAWELADRLLERLPRRGETLAAAVWDRRRDWQA